jgi:hypothetical protein
MMRRAQAKTPPKPDSEIAAKVVNSSATVGGGGAGAAAAPLECRGGRLGAVPEVIEIVCYFLLLGPACPSWGGPGWSFFDNHLRLYSFVPAQAGYGNKRAS